MAINRGNIAKQLLPGLNAVFGLEYGEVNNEHEPLYEIENSDRAFEEEVLFTGFGTAPVKNEGAAVTFDNASESYTARYTNETIALAFAITEEAMEDNLYDTFAKLRAKGSLYKSAIGGGLALKLYFETCSCHLQITQLSLHRRRQFSGCCLSLF